MNYKWLLPLLFIAALFSCNDDSSSIGFSIDTTYVSINVDTIDVDTAKVSVSPVEALPNRTIIQMLGRMTIPGFGEVNADYLSQFYPVAEFDTTLVKPHMIDSVGLEITFQYNSFLGDSLAPMQLTAYKLNRLLRQPENVRDPIYSNINPADYYAEDDKLGSIFYVPSTQSYPDSLLDDDGYRALKLVFGNTPEEKRALALEYYDLYNEHNGYLTTETMNAFFPGVYVTNTFGRGNMLYIISTAVVVYHRTYAYDSAGALATINDSTDVLYEENATTTFLMTSYEAPTINHIEAIPAAEVEALRDAGASIIQAPQMYDGRISLPVDTIISRFNSARSLHTTDTVGVLNTVTLTIPLKPQPTTLKQLGINPPPYLLLMRESGNVATSGKVIPMNKELFFADRLMNDNTNYFYAEYDSTAHAYTFTGLENYIVNIFRNDPNDILEADGALKAEPDNDYDSDMILVPISVVSSSNSTSSSSSYYYYMYYSSSSSVDESIVPYLGSLSYAEIDKERINLQVIYSTKVY